MQQTGAIIVVARINTSFDSCHFVDRVGEQLVLNLTIPATVSVYFSLCRYSPISQRCQLTIRTKRLRGQKLCRRSSSSRAWMRSLYELGLCGCLLKSYLARGNRSNDIHERQASKPIEATRGLLPCCMQMLFELLVCDCGRRG